MVIAPSETRAPLAIDLFHVNHGYRNAGRTTPVLENISLHVEPGEFVALLGPSGCGKSTLLRLLAGLDVTDTGRLDADGIPITGPDPERIIMFQDPHLFPWRRVRANVNLGPHIAGKPDPAVVSSALDLVGLRDFENAWPHQLSGGMAQRVALARALVNNPRLLLLDEPLGKLDSLTRLTMQTELRKLWQQRGYTTIMVTHDVEEALLLATRIVVFSARPARILADIPIDFPTIRHRDDPDLLRLRRTILQELGHSTDW